ncbi:probable CCR4-associated factor 1 homolog 11 [Cajanus cajan]|uniref:probable CCR4-associated factor 1 homolog 11 n=1 Tax=Cajanus cajan TaxID=3821 RepID=UPI00098DB1EB|nr:probable CCR4-associated factor 1 homolog 11 [Cajanus cajan]
MESEFSSEYQNMDFRRDSIVTRSVWACNVEYEFQLIGSVIGDYPFISMDTEFPGVVVRSDPSLLRLPENNYATLKANVDRLDLIQVGLTFSDAEGNLPKFGSSNSFIWEFNFCNFDVTRHLHAPDSIDLLRRQGIDFEKNRRFGIHTAHFAALMMRSGLACNNNIHWITFHGAYDFGYLLKALTGRPLPQNLVQFLHVVKKFFGVRVYDVKHLLKFCPNLYGGLDRVCKSLNLDRMIGKSHQAGSDSLLTLHAFLKIKDTYLQTQDQNSMLKYAGVMYGLEVP